MLFPPDQDLERLSSMLNDVRATGVMLSDTDQCLGVDSNLGGLPTGRSIESSNDGKVSGVHSLKPNGGQSMAQERIPPGLFIRKDSVNSNFIGLNSTGATIAICLRESLERAHSLSKFPSFDFLIDAGSHVDEAGVAHTVDLSVLELPPRLLAIRAIDVFFANVNIVHPIINEDDFRGISERLYTGHRTASTPLELSIFYLITAIGSLCEPENSEMSEQSSRGLYQQAWLLFNDCIAAPSVATVQVLLLHVIFHLQFGKGGIAWVICGLAVRTAQSMGLHRRSPRDFDLSEAQIRLRSQIWWVSFCLDAFVSMTQARPTAVSNSMYDTELTHPDLQHHTSPPLAAMASNLYTWRIKLAQIQNSFCGILNRSETIVARLDSLAELDTTLTSWRDEIQIDCRPEQEILVHNSVYPFIALLHLEYFNIMRAIHWAVMTGLPAKEYDANTHPSVRIRASEAICLGAARSFVKTLNNVADTTGNRKLVPISFQTDYYMAAIAVLYRGIFKQPQSLSAKTDLEYFRAGKIHLVRDIHEMNLSSTLRNLFDEMLASAEALLYQ
ncbi:fungal-specific transcription factor domain-containing protein [Cadophora sp. MPI-SDFR-AT-0126]|nr:fungal-specific transcription factor domain-containing protein [Leotiomycetes sp. MPI-SDFR-AT-0126]